MNNIDLSKVITPKLNKITEFYHYLNKHAELDDLPYVQEMKEACLEEMRKGINDLIQYLKEVEDGQD